MAQRSGIDAGGVLYNVKPGTRAWLSFVDEDKNFYLALRACRQAGSSEAVADNCAQLMYLYSPTCSNTFCCVPHLADFLSLANPQKKISDSQNSYTISTPYSDKDCTK
jgi:hypothetical protein